jgi:hypothetical protein
MCSASWQTPRAVHAPWTAQASRARPGRRARRWHAPVRGALAGAVSLLLTAAGTLAGSPEALAGVRPVHGSCHD